MKHALAFLFLVASVCAVAKPIGLWQGGQTAIVLKDDPGICPRGTSEALYIGPKGQVPGCWFSLHGFVWIMFADGDNIGVPAKVFKFESA